MTVEAIHLGAPRTPELWTVESVHAVAGQGLEGDRHFRATGAKPGQALTLVEAEAVEDVGLAPGGTRRQLTVRGVRLNDLVGKRFRVGTVECFGVELCEPCRHHVGDYDTWKPMFDKDDPGARRSAGARASRDPRGQDGRPAAVASGTSTRRPVRTS